MVPNYLSVKLCFLLFYTMAMADSESKMVRKDTLSEETYARNNFNFAKEDRALSYTSGRVLKSHYNKYSRNNFKLSAYITDWSQYDGRLDNLTSDQYAGRGIDLRSVDISAYDRIIVSFFGIVGDMGENKAKVATAAESLRKSKNEITPVDCWGDVASYRNVGFNRWKSNDYFVLNSEAEAQGILGGITKFKRERNRNLILGVSIGGWTMSEPFSRIVQDAEKRETLIASIAAFFIAFPSFDEIDIDWEYPGLDSNGKGNNANDGENYAIFIKELKYKLNPMNKKINVALSADLAKLEKSNIKGLVEAGVSLFNVMSYDFFGTTWATELTHHTNLKTPKNNNGLSVETAVHKLIKEYGVPPSSINVGCAGYSRNAKGVDITSFNPLRGTFDQSRDVLGTFESGNSEFYDIAKNYFDFEKMKGRNGFEMMKDDEAGANYLYNEKSKLFVSLDTPLSVYKKAEFARLNNLHGVFLWVGEYDRGVLANAAREGFQCDVLDDEVIDMKNMLQD